jgi:hypothetical protein
MRFGPSIPIDQFGIISIVRAIHASPIANFDRVISNTRNAGKLLEIRMRILGTEIMESIQSLAPPAASVLSECRSLRLQCSCTSSTRSEIISSISLWGIFCTVKKMRYVKASLSIRLNTQRKSQKVDLFALTSCGFLV